MFVKLWAGFAFAGLLSTWIGDVAAAIVLAGAAAGTLLTASRLTWTKVVRPLVRLSEILGDLPEWMRERVAAEEAIRATQEEMAGQLVKGHENFEEFRGRLGELEEVAEEAASAAGAAKDAAATSAGVSRSIARHVGAQVRGAPPYPEGE